MIEALKVLRQNSRRNQLLDSLNYGAAESELFLVSFPKSGNTWLRVMMANLLNPQIEEIAFHNLYELIPDSEVADQVGLIQDRRSGFYAGSAQVVKSHDYYQRYYRNKKVIYVVRDPADALTSYYHYLNVRTDQDMDKEVFLAGGNSRVKSWSRHVMGWRRAIDQGALLVKYEDMVADPEGSLARVADFIGLKVSREELATAVGRADFKRMKALEKKYGYFNNNQIKKKSNSEFVRKGKVGEASDVFSEAQLERFARKNAKALAWYGYSRC